MKKLYSLMLSCLIFTSTSAIANDFEPQIISFMEEKASKWVQASEITSAAKAQNAQYATISEDKIQSLDLAWRKEAENGSGPMVDKVLNNSLSTFLSKIKEDSEEAITEIFVFDKKGLNIGQSDITTDFFQGDEAKWEKTVGTSGAKYHLSEVEFDESTQTYQSNLTITVFDNSEAIGAVTIGLNVENLL